jgi:hypothetical protein
MQATFHEEAGYACMQHGLRSEAENHFQNALNIHQSLGARAKYQWLMEKLEKEMISEPFEFSNNSSQKTHRSVFD